jgi:hypothetical protein
LSATRLREGLRAHRGFAIVLAAGLILRLAMLVSYPPAFVSSADALNYLGLAWQPHFVGVLPDRPSGYPMFLDVLEVFGRRPMLIAIVQHLFGLAIGALAYFVLLRRGVRRWLAAAAAGLLVFDAYALTMEHWVLTETLATFLVVTALCLTAASERRAWPLALAGALLAYAVTVHTASLFAIPVWLVYVLWKRRSVRHLIVGLVPLLAVALGYMTWHQHVAGTFQITDMHGWFLYARVGQIGTCGDAKVPKEVQDMCPLMPGAPTDTRTLLWGGSVSPAYEVFGGPTQGGLGADGVLGRYALAIVLDRPWTYTQMVGRDVLRYFDPTDQSETGVLMLKDLPTPIPPDHLVMQQGSMPGYHPTRRAAAGLLSDWSRVDYAVRPVLGLFGALALGFTLVGIVGGRWVAVPRRREEFLFLGAGWLLVVGATATSAFVLRYMLPAVPLLIIGIAFALDDAISLSRAEAARSSRAAGSSGTATVPATAVPAAPRSGSAS